MTKTPAAGKTAVKKPAAKTPAAKSAPKFSKEQLVRSDRFARRRDLLNALLESGRLYTIAEAETTIQQYLKGKVN